MRSSRSLCFILVLVLFLSRGKCCTPFFDLVSSQQRRYLSFQQRGLPRAFTTPFFETFLFDIYKFVENRYKVFDLSTVCFTTTDLQDFYGNVHDGNAIDREVADLKANIPNLPYISMSTSRLMRPKGKRLESASERWLNKTCQKLSKGEVKTAATLPETSQVLFDPVRQENLEMYDAYASHAPRMPVLRLLRIVTGMVITLELAEVSRINSIQLLRHAVAWLSSVFRALQRDGCSLQVPVLFTPFYKAEFERLLEYGRNKVPEVTEYDVAKLLGYDLLAYCQLDAWGKLEILRWKNGKFTDIWTIEQVIFDPNFLFKAAQRVGFRKFDAANYPPFEPDVDGLDGWEMESTVLEPDLSYEIGDPYGAYSDVTPSTETDMGVMESEQSLYTKMRQIGMCQTPHYVHVARPGVSWDQKCCAAICCNSVLMMQVSLSVNECCNECNQAFCHTAGQLASLAMVHLQPYGNDPGGSVPVSL